MAKKMSMSLFIQRMGLFPEIIQQKAISSWDINTQLALGLAQKYSPVRTGHLRGSGRAIKAKITAKGIKSAFVFNVPYAHKLEKGVRADGKPINVRTTINPYAQTGYGRRGAAEQRASFISDLKKVIAEAFGAI